MDGETLRRRRRDLGLSQADLGRLLGVPQNTISRWEVGKARIQHATMLDLALEAIEKRKTWIDLTDAMAKSKDLLGRENDA